MKWVVLALAFLALATPANADAAMFFLFDRPAAEPNDRVTVRGVGAAPPVRLYLVRNDQAADVHTRFDRRLAFVGVLRTARLTFSVPPLDASAYTLAYWCRRCAAFSRGRTFFVQDPARWVHRFRSRGLLRIRTSADCPVTLPNGNRPPRQPGGAGWYGNGLLWAELSQDGVYSVSADRVAADGSIGNKLLWVTTPPWQKPAISGERLDAPSPPLRVSGVNTGSFSGDYDPSYMTPVSFRAAGCWRVRARVGDVSLVYVVRVVVR